MHHYKSRNKMYFYRNFNHALYIILVKQNTMVRVYNNVEQNVVVMNYKAKPKCINYRVLQSSSIKANLKVS